MAQAGYTPVDELKNLRKLGSIYQGHPDIRFIPALEASTGSLGQGLSVGIGMALADRLDGRPSRTYVILGDGEVQEGQIWEAAMFAPFHKVDNLVCIVDYNKIQLDGFVKDILDLEPARREVARVRMARSSNWTDTAFRRCRRHSRKRPRPKESRPASSPNTIKGKGVSFMENNPKYHGVAPTEQEMKLALQEIG